MQMNRSKTELLKNFILFSLTSMVGTVVDLALHWVLSAFLFRGNYWGSFWVAPIVSFEVAAMVNFIIAYFFVWKERISQRSVRSFWRHFAAYNAAGVGAFLIKFAVMQGLHFAFVSLGWFQQTTLEPVICNLIGLCFSGTFNFFMSEFLIFNKTSKREKMPEELGD